MPDRRATPGHLLLKTAMRLRSRGVKEVIELVGGRIRDTVSSEGRLVIFCIETAVSSEGRDDIVLRRGRPEDGAAYARDIGTDSAGTFRARLSQDTWCYLVETEGSHLVHATWCTTGGAWTREVGACLVPPEGSAYVYESFTLADARGRGIYPFALRGISADLASRGIGRLWVAVESDNIPSLRAVAKAGFREASHVSFRRRWGRVEAESGPEASTQGMRLESRCPS